MRYLFIVQGEGRGHLTQAISLSEMLRRNGHEVVEVLVGKCSNREIPPFFEERIGVPLCRFESPSLDYGKSGKKGKIVKSIIKNTTPRKLAKYKKSISLIVERVDKCKPDVIINLYEFLMGFAALLHRIKVPIISIAHQFLVDHPDYPYRSKTDYGQLFLRMNNMICSIGTTKILALSFYPMKDFYRDRMAVVPPLMREEVKDLKPYNGGYVLGYMLNKEYLEEVKTWHKSNPGEKIHLFWDKKDAPERLKQSENFMLHRIHDKRFLEHMEGCSSYITTAGFESICEAIYLGKPVMMIPAHVEQEINAQDAAGVGAGVISDSFDVSKLIEYAPTHTADRAKFQSWVDSAEEIFIRHLTTLV